MLAPLRICSRWIIGLAVVEASAQSGLPSPVAEKVGVDLVNVEVFVSTRGVTPVPPLAAADFELLEDGRPVELTHFSRFEGGSPVPAPALLEEAVKSPDRLLLPPSEEGPLHVVIYVDHSNIRAATRGELFQALDLFLAESLRPEDRVMIVAFNDSLKVHRSFTSGAEIRLSDFGKLQMVLGRGTHAQREENLLIRQMEQASIERIRGVAPEPPELAHRVRSFVTSEHARILDALGGLERFTDSLGGLPGRKAIIYVGDGIPTRPGRALFEAWQNKFAQFGREAGMGGSFVESQSFDISSQIRGLVAHANASRATFYAVEASGAAQHTALSAEQHGGFDSRAVRTQGGGRVMTTDVASAQELESRGALEYLASHTGGLSIRGKVGPTHFKEVTNDFTTFYSLAYRPSHPADGKFHEIRVRVRREGVRVRHRDGYQAKSADEKTSELALAALLLDSAPNPLAVRLEAGDQKEEKKGVFGVPIMVKVPIALLAVLPQQTMHVAQLSIFIVTQDDRGRTSAVQKREIPIRIPSEKLEAARSQVAAFPITLALRSGAQRVAIGVRDEYASTRSAVSLNLWVGKGRS